MTRLILLPAVMAGVLGSYGHAELIERDWKTPGDRLLTYDTRTELEWLDVSVSLLVQFDPNSITVAVQQALLELDEGGRFEGFTLASKDLTLELMQSAGIDTAVERSEEPNDIASAESVIDLLGVETLWRGVAVHGVVDEPGDPQMGPQVRQSFFVGVSPATRLRPNGKRDSYFSSGSDIYVPRTTGLYLSRIAVPEPATFGLLVVQLAALLTLRHGRVTAADARKAVLSLTALHHAADIACRVTHWTERPSPHPPTSPHLPS